MVSAFSSISMSAGTGKMPDDGSRVYHAAIARPKDGREDAARPDHVGLKCFRHVARRGKARNTAALRSTRSVTGERTPDEGCRFATTPVIRAEFWTAKFAANRLRDKKVHEALIRQGWRVATIWACALRKPAQVFAACEQLAAWLDSSTTAIVIGEEDVVLPVNGPLASSLDA